MNPFLELGAWFIVRLRHSDVAYDRPKSTGCFNGQASNGKSGAIFYESLKGRAPPVEKHTELTWMGREMVSSICHVSTVGIWDLGAPFKKLPHSQGWQKCVKRRHRNIDLIAILGEPGCSIFSAFTVLYFLNVVTNSFYTYVLYIFQFHNLKVLTHLYSNTS